MSDVTFDPATQPPVDPEPFGAAYVRAMNKAEQEGTPEPSASLTEADTPDLDAAAEPDVAPLAPEPVAKTGKPRHDPQARVREATAKAAEAERKAQQLEARLAETERQLRERSQPAPAPRVEANLDGEPKIEHFEDAPDPYAAWVAAKAEWRAEQKFEQKWAARERIQAEHAVETANAARFQQAMAEDPDLPALMEAADETLVRAGRPRGQEFPEVMIDAIKRSELGPQIARYLGSHPEDLVQLTRELVNMPRSAATVVQRLLEAKASASPPALSAAVSTGSAAALPRPSAVPITPVRTSREPAPDKDPSDQPFGRDYVRRMNARERRGA